MKPLTITTRKNRVVLKRANTPRRTTTTKIRAVARRGPLTCMITNREKLERFLRVKGCQVELVDFPLWPESAITLFGFIGVDAPKFTFPRYKNLTGTLRDFVVHFNTTLRLNRDFDPQKEFFMFLLAQMDPKEASVKEANSVMSFIGGKKEPGRKKSEDTDLILSLRHAEPKISYGRIAEVLIAKHFPNVKLKPHAKRDEKQKYRQIVAKTIGYHRKSAAADRRYRNYFRDYQQLMCVFRTGEKFFIVESSGDDPPK